MLLLWTLFASVVYGIIYFIEYTNVSVYNTKIYFIYIKYYIDRATCFGLHWVILRPLKENRSNITYMFYGNALWDPKYSQNIIEVQYKL